LSPVQRVVTHLAAACPADPRIATKYVPPGRGRPLASQTGTSQPPISPPISPPERRSRDDRSHAAPAQSREEVLVRRPDGCWIAAGFACA